MMRPEQVWQAALGELRLQLTRATYQTWLSEAHLVAREADTYVIGVGTDHTRDWLTNRFYHAIKRTLQGITGEQVDVRFVSEPAAGPAAGSPAAALVVPAAAEADAPPGWAPLREALKQWGDAQAGAGFAARTAAPPSPAAPGTDGRRARRVLARQAYRTAYEAIVQPHQIVRLPSVFLTRWVRLLGPRRAWLVVAFWQLAYLAGLFHAAHGSRKRLDHQERACLQVSGRDLARWAGISHSTFWEYIANPGYLSWFVRDVARGQYRIGAAGRPQQDVNLYDVWLTPPLTPADQAHVRAWLRARAPTPDLDGLLVALEQALGEPAGRLLAPDPAAPSPTESTPATIAELALQAVTGARPRNQSERQALANLCDDLYAHIYSPEHDYLTISHYFVRNWLPRIKHGAAWIIIYLRSLCAADRANSGMAAELWIDKGLETLAALAGAGETRKVRRWLQKSSRKPGDRWSVAWLADVVHTRKRSDQGVDVQFRVPLGREVLTPADCERRDQLLAEFELRSVGQATEVTTKSGLIGGDGEGQIQTHRERGWEPKSDGLPAKSGHTAAGGGSQNPSAYRPNSESLRVKVVVAGVGEKVLENGWDIRSLLDTAGIVGDLRDRVLAANATGPGYVAWYLLGVRRKRSKGRQNGIANPGAFAAVQLAKGKLRCDDGRLNALAALGPIGVATCMYWQDRAQHAPACPLDWEPARQWMELVGDRVRPAELGLEQAYQLVQAVIERGSAG